MENAYDVCKCWIDIDIISENAYECIWHMQMENAYVTYGMPCGIISYRFKYRFGPQPLTFVSNWFLTFQLCQFGPQSFNCVSKWSLLLSDGWNMLT